MVIASLLSVSACGTALSERRTDTSQADYSARACISDGADARIALVSPSEVSTRSADDYLNKCGEQVRMVHHEVENCRSITVLSVPLD